MARCHRDNRADQAVLPAGAIYVNGLVILAFLCSVEMDVRGYEPCPWIA
jgi:hypothetical protein